MKWLFFLKNDSKAAPDSVNMEHIASLRRSNAMQANADILSDIYQARLQYARGWTHWALYCITAVLAVFITWAALADIEEVTSGSGKVVINGREQIVQSIETGVLAALMVAEGDTVKAGQPLLRIDDVRLGASVKESQSHVDALTASAIRLRAESQGTALNFPADIVSRYPALVRSEQETHEARRRALASMIQSQQQALRLSKEELSITEPMAAKGLVSDLDVLRIRRSIVEAHGRIDEANGKYRADAAAELARVQAELGAQHATLIGREDSFRRAIMYAPKSGVVKNIKTNTIGSVVQTGQDLLEIVPINEALLIETRIRPADIAFLRPGLPAVVKITAYDSGIYGWLNGTVMQISADTLHDDVRRDETYYRVLVRTQRSALLTPNGKSLPIIPGMLAQVDIKTGHKTVLSYLFKPVLRAREALRER